MASGMRLASPCDLAGCDQLAGAGRKTAAMGIKERSRERRKRIVVNLADSHEDAERWDLEFWQSQTPQMRLSALVAIRRDLEKIKGRR